MSVCWAREFWDSGMLGGIVSSKLANRWRAGLLDKLCLHRVCAAVLLVFACAVQHCTHRLICVCVIVYLRSLCKWCMSASIYTYTYTYIRIYIHTYNIYLCMYEYMYIYKSHCQQASKRASERGYYSSYGT